MIERTFAFEAKAMHLSNPALTTCETYTPGLPAELIAARTGRAVAEIAKLGSAENPFGPSPLAMEAVQAALSRMSIYADWTAAPLRRKIGETYGVDPDSVVCGAGETEVISWLIRAFAGPGERILMHEPCFPLYFLFAEAEGRVPVSMPMGDSFDFRVDDFVAAIDETIRIVFVTRPHSPSGKMIDEASVRRIIEVARHALVAVDEAYVHFSRDLGLIHLAREYPNVIVLRTFSKAYGLAGLRVGFGVSHPRIARPLLALKPTWNMGQLQIAGASAALDDVGHVERTVAMVEAMRAYVTDRIRALNGYRVIDGSSANFFLVEITHPDLDSTTVFERLLDHGVIVKDGSVSFRGLGKRYLRVDVSLKKHMDRLVTALGAVAAEA